MKKKADEKLDVDKDAEIKRAIKSNAHIPGLSMATRRDWETGINYALGMAKRRCFDSFAQRDRFVDHSARNYVIAVLRKHGVAVGSLEIESRKQNAQEAADLKFAFNAVQTAYDLQTKNMDSLSKELEVVNAKNVRLRRIAESMRLALAQQTSAGTAMALAINEFTL